jgi:hypothetical protein
MRAFVFVNDNLQAVTTAQAGNNLPRPTAGEWTFNRQMDDAAKELTAQEVNTLKSEGFFIKQKS